MTSFSIQAEIKEAVSSFRIDEAQLRRALLAPVTQDLAKRAIRVEAAAKHFASGRPGPNVRTGRLRGSITWRIGMDPLSPYADVGTNVLYAPYVELGHNIVRGGVIVGRAPAYPFLVPALPVAAIQT